METPTNEMMAFECVSIEVPVQGNTYVGRGVLTLHWNSVVTISAEYPGTIVPIRAEDRHIESVTGLLKDGSRFWSEKNLLVSETTTSGSSTQSRLILSPLYLVIEFTGKSQVWRTRRYWIKNARLHGAASVKDGAYDVALSAHTRVDHEDGDFTGTLVFSAQEEIEYADDFQIEDDWCRLLSISQRAPTVLCVSELFNGDGDRVRIEVLPYHYSFRSQNPLVRKTAEDITNFITRVLPQYRANRDDYGLVYLQEYYWRVFAESTLEIQFMLASVFMEALKFNWAKNVAKLQTDTKVNGLIRAFVHTTTKGKTARYDFKELLELLAKDIGYTGGPFQFIDDRNCIFHTGQAAAAQKGAGQVFPYLDPILADLINQMDDLLLFVLGYQGNIYRYGKPNTLVTFP